MQRKKSKKCRILKTVGLVGIGMAAGTIIGWNLGTERMHNKIMSILEN